MTLEFPSDLETQIERAATARGTDPATWIIEAARRALNEANAKSQMEAAIEKIEANPIRTLGPVDAAADLEEVRAARAANAGETPAQRRAHPGGHR